MILITKIYLLNSTVNVRKRQLIFVFKHLEFEKFVFKRTQYRYVNLFICVIGEYIGKRREPVSVSKTDIKTRNRQVATWRLLFSYCYQSFWREKKPMWVNVTKHNCLLVATTCPFTPHLCQLIETTS